MKKISAILVLSLMAFAPTRIQDNTPQTLPFSQNWTNAGLITVDDTWTGVPGITGYRGDNLTAVTGADPQLLLAPAVEPGDNPAGVVDVNANRSDPNVFTTGGVTEFDGIANPVVALSGSVTADAPFILIHLNTTCKQNINVAYNLRDIDGSVDNAIQPVALQYRIGNTGNFTNIPAGYVADATTGPILATLVTPVSVQLPAAANNQSVVQIRVITTNAVGNDEWVGIDDINITGTPLTTWLGATSSDWFNPANWPCGLPTPTTDVLILPGTPNPPIISPAPIAQAHNLFVYTGALLISPAFSQLHIYGDLTLQGQFQPGTGELHLLGPGTHNISGGLPVQSFFDVFYDIPAGAVNFGGAINRVVARNVNVQNGTVNAQLIETEMLQLTLTGGTYNAGSSTKVSGNWNNNGGTFTPGTGMVELNGGAGTQSIGGSLPTTFYNLIINNTGSGVMLGNNVNANALTLTAGKITLGSSNLTVQTSITGASSSRNVVTNGAGALRRAVSAAGTYLFPVGHSGDIQEASINFAAPLGAANTLAARFITGSGGSNGLPLNESGDPIDRTSVIGYWEITAASPFADAYTGTFIARGFGDIIDYTKLHLLKRANAASPWVLEGTHVSTSGSNALASLQRTGMSGFSQFGVGGQQGVSLPVAIISFSGYKEGNTNKLRWTTGSEQNNIGFEVQRSTDGVNYMAIGFVNSQALGGNSTVQLNYFFTDNNVTGSRQYYRLRQVDFDNHSKLSNIILIKGDKPVTLMIDGLFPNPASSMVNVLIAAPGKDNVTLVVTDIAGRIVTQEIVNVETGSNTIPVDISRLTNGTYMVKLVCSDNCDGVVGKFIKQ